MLGSYSATTITVPSLDSQGGFLSEFPDKESKDISRISAALLKLDDTYLQILLTVSDFSGIQAKALGQKVNLSRYAALNRAKKLEEKRLLIIDRVPTSKTGIKPAMAFYLSPGLSKELIESVLQTQGNKSAPASQPLNIAQNPKTLRDFNPEAEYSSFILPASEDEPRLSLTSGEEVYYLNNFDSPMSHQLSHPQSTQFVTATINSTQTEEIFKKVQEFILLQKEVKRKEKELRALGGSAAEDLIAVLKAEEY